MEQLELRFELIAGDWEDLARWISSEQWPFHLRTQPTFDDVLEQAGRGNFASEEVRSFWVLQTPGPAAGFLRIFDIGDVTPLFDLRVRRSDRGQGVGTAALRWATSHVFETLHEANRFAGYTRHDNVAMRRVFERCGFTPEAHHREAWRTDSGELVDCVGYAILRREWEETVEASTPAASKCPDERAT
ncbi:MAG TPA: GNAT family protein [Actinomycetota bacterium]|nr:GNAT family protein [Actinomycetota bacterium]